MATSEESAGDGPDGRDRLLNELEREIADSIREGRPPEIESDAGESLPEPSGEPMRLADLEERRANASDLQEEVRDDYFEAVGVDP
jgi:hypothetical protein